MAEGVVVKSVLTNHHIASATTHHIASATTHPAAVQMDCNSAMTAWILTNFETEAKQTKLKLMETLI
jgi:hypothetical protein